MPPATPPDPKDPIVFDTEVKAIQLASASPHASPANSAVETLGRVSRAAEPLDYGRVGVDTGLVSMGVARSAA